MEKSVVLIENNQYLGYSYVPLEKIKPLLLEEEVETEAKEREDENENEGIDTSTKVEAFEETEVTEVIEEGMDLVIEYDEDALVYEEQETFIEADADLAEEEEEEAPTIQEPIADSSIENPPIDNTKALTTNEVYELTTFHKLTILPHIRKELIPFRENPDVQQIIRGYLRKKRKTVWVYQF